jgi:surface antigen
MLAIGCAAPPLGASAAAAHTARLAAAAPTPQSDAQIAARRAASAWSATDGPGVLRAFRNGQCTDWAARKRPDVLERIYTYAFALSFKLRHTVIVDNWAAGRWTAHAIWAHIPTGHLPKRGALMVFQHGEYDGTVVAGTHIAYVEKVNRDGSFRISQMHSPRLWHLTYQTFPASVARLQGISFIYR